MSLLKPTGGKSNHSPARGAEPVAEIPPRFWTPTRQDSPCDLPVLREKEHFVTRGKTKEQSQELNRQHHSTEHVQPRRDVQCLEAREAHGGPAGPDLCLIRL